MARVRYPCSDEVILDVIKRFGRGRPMRTWIIASCVRDLHHGYDVDTKWMRAKLIRMERAKTVCRAKTPYDTQINWTVP